MDFSASERPVQHRGKGRAGAAAGAGAPPAHGAGRDAQALPHPDWVRHTLVVIGTPAAIAAFRQAAAGSGGIPWAYPDLDMEEDDRFLALVHPPDGSPGLSPAAARVLAQELRAAAFQHQRRVRAQAGHSRLCPFDLQALIPIPSALLDLGPDDQATVAWRRTHWGVLQALRKVTFVSAGCKRLRGKREQLTVEFWSADWTPWPAIATLRRRFADLTFTVTPDYGCG
jgi:hypothetical protein